MINEHTQKSLTPLQLLNNETNCVLKSYEEETAGSEKNIITPTTEFDGFPRYEKFMGEYVALDSDIELCLNYRSVNHEAIANIFLGSLLFVEKFTVLILSVEVYPRDLTHDIHSEASYESYPEEFDQDERYYKKLKIAVIQGPDRGQPIKKLVIGTEKLNVLVTSTAILEPKVGKIVTAGPTTNTALYNCNLNNAQILLRKQSVEKFNNNVRDEFSMNNCRQLTSGIGHNSTHFAYRRNFFQSLVMQPATIFTLHQYPLVGYSLSQKNSSRKLSFYFALVVVYGSNYLKPKIYSNKLKLLG